MGLFSKDIKSMDDLFLHTLRDIFYAENQIVKALPKLIEKATNRELTSGLSSHLHETEGQIARLEQVFAKLGQTPRGIDCPAIDGLIKEADEVAGEVDDTPRCSMPRLSAVRKLSSITRLRVMARSSPGPRNLATIT